MNDSEGQATAEGAQTPENKDNNASAPLQTLSEAREKYPIGSFWVQRTKGSRHREYLVARVDGVVEIEGFIYVATRAYQGSIYLVSVEVFSSSYPRRLIELEEARRQEMQQTWHRLQAEREADYLAVGLADAKIKTAQHDVIERLTKELNAAERALKERNASGLTGDDVEALINLVSAHSKSSVLTEDESVNTLRLLKKLQDSRTSLFFLKDVARGDLSEEFEALIEAARRSVAKCLGLSTEQMDTTPQYGGDGGYAEAVDFEIDQLFRVSRQSTDDAVAAFLDAFDAWDASGPGVDGTRGSPAGRLIAARDRVAELLRPSSRGRGTP